MINRILSCLMLLTITACSKQPDCLVADVNKLVGETIVNGETLYVYLQTTGINDKQNFYTVYSEKPAFDACGRAEIESKHSIHIDLEEGAPSKLTLTPEGASLEYSQDNQGSIVLDAVMITH